MFLEIHPERWEIIEIGDTVSIQKCVNDSPFPFAYSDFFISFPNLFLHNPADPSISCNRATRFLILQRASMCRVDDLVTANPSIDPNVLAVGQEIVIPGLEGVTGVLETEVISLGDSLRSLSRRTQVSEDAAYQS